MIDMNMEFKDFVYVIAIAEHQSMTKAANALYITQPTLSKFLQRLEDSLGVELFERRGKKLVLTLAGEQFIARAREMLAMRSHLEQEILGITNSNSGTLRLGFSPLRSTEMILNTIPVFSQQYPNIRLELVETSYKTFEPLLLDGKVDFVFTNLPIKSSQIDYRVLFSEEIIMLASRDHPLNEKAVEKEGCRYPWIDLKLIRDEPMILLSNHLRIQTIIDACLKEAQIVPRVLLRTEHIPAACLLAAEGHGICFTSEHCLKYIKFDHEPSRFSIGVPNAKRTFVLAYRRGTFIPGCVETLIGLVKDNCSGR